MKVFLSWSGRRAWGVANALHAWLSTVLQEVEPWFSSSDIDAGRRWSTEIASQLGSVQVGVVVLTPENLDAPWIYFEAGAISRVLEDSSVCTYLVGLRAMPADNPLAQFQATRADRSGTECLLRAINRRLRRPLSDGQLSQAFERWWPDLERQLGHLAGEPDPLVELESARVPLSAAAAELERSELLGKNVYLRTIVLDSVRDQCRRLHEVCDDSAGYRLPHVLYPPALVEVLKKCKPTVKAVAIVDGEEYFWRGKQGEEIRRNTTENSSRLFVFRTPEHMRENMGMLLQHARSYNSYAVSYDNLTREFPGHVHDFSLIGDIGTRVLARYDDGSTGKYIRFVASTEEVSQYEDVFSDILETVAVRVPEEYSLEDTDDLISAAFETRVSALDRRTIEMSAYIPIHIYDLHEEEHAYFVEMMQRMIKEISAHRVARGGGRIRILELGAGTGIFTRRLAELSDAEIVALEIDWACYLSLQHKMDSLAVEIAARNTRIECFNADSRVYNPPGRFDYVVSSFADHHIKPYDKPKYFANIRRNLQSHGVAIIGDEFVPDYDRGDPESRRIALRTYHEHIIQRAQADGREELIRLEAAALKSGLEELGDFKVSCQEYEAHLEEAGFTFTREKIGPLGRDELGGVWVYLARVEE